MFTAEQLESWNKIFPDCQIRESDLKQPTEAFLIKTLVAYLKFFGYKVEPPMAIAGEDNSRERRLFLIKLTRHIDYILKITRKTYTFTYYELVQPTAKKTSHMLHILLNYIYYYNMYRTESFEMANERIQKFEQLQECIKNTELDNEQRKRRFEEVKSEIDVLREESRVLKSDLETLHVKQKQQKHEMQTLQESIKQLNGQLKKLAPQKHSLQSQVVSDNEARDLQNKLIALQEEIAEQKRHEMEITNNIKHHIEHINAMEELLGNIKEVKEVFPLKLLEDYKHLREKLKAAKANAVALATDHTNQLGTLNSQEKELRMLEDKENLKKTQFDKERSQKQQLLEKLNETYNWEKEKLAQLKADEQALECALGEQHDIKSYLKENIQELLSAYK